MGSRGLVSARPAPTPARPASYQVPVTPAMPSARRADSLSALLGLGALAFLLAVLSIGDMFLPRPYDGVVIEADAPGRLVVRQVVPGSGAARAGIQPGDRILGIDRELLRSPAHAARQLNRFRVGETVPYFIEGPGGVRELPIQLGPRRIGGTSYLYACGLGFAFFGVGLFVLLQRPGQRASEVFFLMSSLFMLVLICRLRPASYSLVDTFVLSAGTMALLLLPAAFLHFFLIFPEPAWPKLGAALGWQPATAGFGALIGVLYTLPPVVLLAALAAEGGRLEHVSLISGAPAANWWVLSAYLLLGLGLLGYGASTLEDRRRRQGALLVLAGSVFGLLPFLVLAVGFPALVHTEKFLFYGVVPLVLVPVTFAYAIVRFQLLDIRVILRRSLLYTATTALITAFYAAGIAGFHWLFRETPWVDSPYWPIVLALAILLLFEPLRRRFQGVSQRFFFAERSLLQRAAREIGESFVAQQDVRAGLERLVGELPRMLGLHFAGLYLDRDGRLWRQSGPSSLPAELPHAEALGGSLWRSGGLERLGSLGRLQRSPQTAELLDHLLGAGVEVLGVLGSSRRRLGLLVLSQRAGQLSFEDDDLDLLRALLHQASMALEAQALLEERTRQAELERELEIAASIQASLQPSSLRLGEGWTVAAACRPARQVGGDFITELPGPSDGSRALAYGDVSGKSVSGALVMMAAVEILHSLALTARDPVELVRLANRRLYNLQRGGFVALGYLAPALDRGGLHYLIAGQPQPLKRALGGAVEELPLPDHRVPLGALMVDDYRILAVSMTPGDVVLGYSDGVVEARSPEGEFFGAQRLISALASGPAEPQGLVQWVLAEVERFTGGTELYDDLTLVAVARQPEADA